MNDNINIRNIELGIQEYLMKIKKQKQKIINKQKIKHENIKKN